MNLYYRIKSHNVLLPAGGTHDFGLSKELGFGCDDLALIIDVELIEVKELKAKKGDES